MQSYCKKSEDKDHVDFVRCEKGCSDRMMHSSTIISFQDKLEMMYAIIVSGRIGGIGRCPFMGRLATVQLKDYRRPIMVFRCFEIISRVLNRARDAERSCQQ